MGERWAVEPLTTGEGDKPCRPLQKLDKLVVDHSLARDEKLNESLRIMAQKGSGKESG